MVSFLKSRARTGALALAVFGVLSTAASPSHSAKASTIQGIDVSVWQGSAQGTSIDWRSVAQSGIAFAYIRAAEGSSVIDSDFRTNWFHALAAGVTPGAYLFFHPGDDPHAQASLLLRLLQAVNFSQGDLLPTLDVEVTDGQPQSTIVSNLQAAVNDIAAAIGVKPVIYTSPVWWDQNVGSSAFVDEPLWVANWGVSSPSLPANGWGGNGARVWQYSDAGSVPGITGRVDRDQASAGGLPYFGSPAAHPVVPNMPAAAADAAGHQYIVWKGTDSNLWEASWDGTRWTGPTFRGMGPLGSQPTIAVKPNGEIHVFWKGTEGSLWEAVGGAGGWSGPYNHWMGPLGSAPSATAWGNEIDVFWEGTDRNLWEGFTNGAWHGPFNFGFGPLGSAPAAAAHSSGEQDVFWTGTDNQLWEGYWTGSRWIGPMALNLRPAGTQPAAAVLSNDDEAVVWCGVDGNVVVTYWRGSGWTSPSSVGMGPLGSDPTVAAWGTELDVFWQGTEHSLWETYRPSSSWHGPMRIGMGPLG
jgi:GH25 family lysozyme M1 (1,4-beta-N-acetylmuramidase)